MVDFDRSHAWAWDARPFPDFPGNSSLWSDGGNYAKGHWLNGRTSNQQLSAVVSEICLTSGLVETIDIARLHGSVRGFSTREGDSARSKLQTLSLVFGFDASEGGGDLVFSGRRFSDVIEISENNLVISSGRPETTQKNRGASAETVGRVRLTYIQAENDFENQVSESVFPSSVSGNSLEAEVSVQLTQQEANSIVESLLSESQLAGERIQFTVPFSQIEVHSGSLISLSEFKYRVDRVEIGTSISCDGIRVDPSIYSARTERGDVPLRSSSLPPTPAFVTFLDLPLLRGDESPFAPHVAVTTSPWPGAFSVWSSSADSGYSLNVEVEAPTIVGTTQTALLHATPGLWDNGSALKVTFSSENVASAPRIDVLNGVNIAAIGDGSPEGWEIFQFSEAELISPGTFELRGLLRGLAGTDATAPLLWPAGSLVVLIDSNLHQIALPQAARGLDRYYRIGASENGYADTSIVTHVEAFNGIGLRPYSVVHLQYDWELDGTLQVSWVRRTRVDGDSWSSVEVPLGEEVESYVVTVLKDNAVIRQSVSGVTSWTYTSSMMLEDLVTPPFEVRVGQSSVSFGLGPLKEVTVV